MIAFCMRKYFESLEAFPVRTAVSFSDLPLPEPVVLCASAFGMFATYPVRGCAVFVELAGFVAGGV